MGGSSPHLMPENSGLELRIFQLVGRRQAECDGERLEDSRAEVGLGISMFHNPGLDADAAESRISSPYKRWGCSHWWL